METEPVNDEYTLANVPCSLGLSMRENDPVTVLATRCDLVLEFNRVSRAIFDRTRDYSGRTELAFPQLRIVPRFDAQYAFLRDWSFAVPLKSGFLSASKKVAGTMILAEGVASADYTSTQIKEMAWQLQAPYECGSLEVHMLALQRVLSDPAQYIALVVAPARQIGDAPTYRDTQLMLCNLMLYPSTTAARLLAGVAAVLARDTIELAVRSIQAYVEAKLLPLGDMRGERALLHDASRSVRIGLPNFDEPLWGLRVAHYAQDGGTDAFAAEQLNDRDRVSIVAYDTQGRLIGHVGCELHQRPEPPKPVRRRRKWSSSSSSSSSDSDTESETDEMVVEEEKKTPVKKKEEVRKEDEPKRTPLPDSMRLFADAPYGLYDTLEIGGLYVDPLWRGGQSRSLAVLLMFHAFYFAAQCTAELGVRRVACQSAVYTTALIMRQFGGVYMDADNAITWMEKRLGAGKSIDDDIDTFYLDWWREIPPPGAQRDVLQKLKTRYKEDSGRFEKQLDEAHELTGAGDTDTFLYIGPENDRFHRELTRFIKLVGSVATSTVSPLKREGAEREEAGGPSKRTKMGLLCVPLDALPQFVL